MSIPSGNDNPFAPPKAAVLEAEAQGREGEEYIPDGQKVATGRGAEWFGEAWTLFKAAPGTWVAIFVIFILLSMLLAIIPMGSLASSLFYPAVVAGLMIGCRTIEEGGTLEISHLFAGFKDKLGSLVLVGVLYLVGVMLIGFMVGIAAAFMIPSMMGRNFADSDMQNVLSMLPFILLIILVVLALMMPLIMALWFAPALVVFHDVQPMAAMKSSFNGCLRNIMPFLVYGIVGFLLGIAAVIPLGLGMLVLGPVMWGTMYVGYRDIFVRRA
jgi:uncharacterized membrane protein